MLKMKSRRSRSGKPANKCAMAVWMILSVLVLSPGCFADLEEGRALLKETSMFLTRKLLPIAQEALFDLDVSPECSGALLKFMSALKRNEPWALKSEYEQNVSSTN